MNQKKKVKGKVQWCTKAQQKLQKDRVAGLESTPEREAWPAAGEDERPAAPLQDVGRGPPRAEAAR